jgi:hypothetical protein
MRDVQKAFVMLSAAITMGAFAGGTVEAKSKAGKGPDRDTADKDKQDKQDKKKRVNKVKRARKRPADWDADLGMPAGTLYDVITLEDAH